MDGIVKLRKEYPERVSEKSMLKEYPERVFHD